jgi:hypothetical protein
MRMESPLKKDDFVMHKEEGWYGKVVDVNEKIYRVMILDPKQFYRAEDLNLVPADEIPFHIRQRALQG